MPQDFGGFPIVKYCWWKKSQTTPGMYKKPCKYWDKLPSSTGAGFLNHQQYHCCTAFFVEFTYLPSQEVDLLIKVLSARGLRDAAPDLSQDSVEMRWGRLRSLRVELSKQGWKNSACTWFSWFFTPKWQETDCLMIFRFHLAWLYWTKKRCADAWKLKSPAFQSESSGNSMFWCTLSQQERIPCGKTYLCTSTTMNWLQTECSCLACLWCWKGSMRRLWNRCFLS